METQSEDVGATTTAEAQSAEDSAKAAAPEPAAEIAAKPKSAAERKLPMAAQIDDLFAAVRRLESFAADEAKRVSGKLVPTVEERAKKNIWVSLLLALGLGLLLGIWLTGGRRRE